MPEDLLWPRASEWLKDGDHPDFGVLGVGTHLTSISPTNAHQTPDAVRRALRRYSTWSHSTGVDLGDVRAVDLGNVLDPDGPQGEERTIDAVRGWTGGLLVALGGDNALTYPVAVGTAATALVTLDAHHDLRDGISNGSPVRRLLEAGIPGSRIVQIGLLDFSNSPAYAARAREEGITIVTRDEVARRGMATVMRQALDSQSGQRIHVDLDVDVCDRSVVPACPAAAPGGVSAHELRTAARIAGSHPDVVSMDLAEVDATADAEDERTIRLVALCLLEAAAGFGSRAAQYPSNPETQKPSNRVSDTRERWPGNSPPRVTRDVGIRRGMDVRPP